MFRRKRNSNNITEEERGNEVADSLKKFRISIDPGELRFNHDIEDPRFSNICEIYAISVHTMNRQPLVIQVHIGNLFPMTHPLHNLYSAWPSKFTMQIPRFYPHEMPAIYMVDVEWNDISPWNMATQSDDRRIAHPNFLHEWDATKGFYDIIRSLITTLECVASPGGALAPNSPPVIPPQPQWAEVTQNITPTFNPHQAVVVEESADSLHDDDEEEENGSGMMEVISTSSEW